MEPCRDLVICHGAIERDRTFGRAQLTALRNCRNMIVTSPRDWVSESVIYVVPANETAWRMDLCQRYL